MIANLVPLEAIATLGSAGFLLLFLAVDIANVRLAPETGARAWIYALATLGTAVALIVLCVEVDENPATRNHLWILLAMILVSFGIELTYRGISGRRIHLVRKSDKWMPGGNPDLQALVNLRCVPVGNYQICVLTGQFQRVLPCL